jgi:hypothetical protein
VHFFSIRKHKQTGRTKVSQEKTELDTFNDDDEHGENFGMVSKKEKF